MNEQNLRPITLSHDEAMKNGRKGGIASGEARRQRKRMRDYAVTILDLPVKDKRKSDRLQRMGIELKEIDNEMLILVGLIEKAQNGDVAAAREIRSIIGEDAYFPTGYDGEHDGLFDAIAKAVMDREV